MEEFRKKNHTSKTEQSFVTSNVFTKKETPLRESPFNRCRIRASFTGDFLFFVCTTFSLKYGGHGSNGCRT